jgi:hypothetical protein
MASGCSPPHVGAAQHTRKLCYKYGFVKIKIEFCASSIEKTEILLTHHHPNELCSAMVQSQTARSKSALASPWHLGVHRQSEAFSGCVPELRR